MSLDLSCPSCKSDITQRLSVVYEHGISDVKTSTRSTGIGFGRGGIGLGLGRSKTKGTSQSAMSLKASPPPKKRYLKPLGYIFLAYLFSSFVFGRGEIAKDIVLLLWAVGSISWTVFAFNYNTKSWPPLKSIWDDSFICNRCNHMFHIGT